ncbi:MAG TPA: hypothetical protein PKZ83_09200, partial [bacterium]|nr:hypothetical protein [bacterium]HQJ64853.1 hypothetical protein [bacterium]
TLDFESSASTNFTTPAKSGVNVLIFYNIVKMISAKFGNPGLGMNKIRNRQRFRPGAGPIGAVITGWG